jgi:hypothetical protein
MTPDAQALDFPGAPAPEMLPVTFVRDGLMIGGQVHLANTTAELPAAMAGWDDGRQVEELGDVYFQRGITARSWEPSEGDGLPCPGMPLASGRGSVMDADAQALRAVGVLIRAGQLRDMRGRGFWRALLSNGREDRPTETGASPSKVLDETTLLSSD